MNIVSYKECENMANTTSTIGIRVVTDSSGAIKGIEQVGDKLGKLPSKTGAASDGLDELNRAAKIERMQAVGDIMSSVSDKLVSFGKGAIEASAKWTALDSQWSTVWGNMEGEANKSINSIGKETSILPNRLKPAMTSIAAFAKTAGFDTAGSLDLASRATMAAADSAAFYDRSLEDTTESLKSYLKGNFENDAALGISSTETTRNAAANKLYGKSFKDLAEDQKQLTLLQMVEDGNKLSGALGQAAREGDGLENVMGNLNQAQEDFSRAIGDVIQPLFISFLKTAANAIKTITDKFNGLPQPVKEIIVLTGALIAGGTALMGAWATASALFTALGIAGVATIGAFIGIAAAVAAVIVVFKNWDKIVEKLPKGMQNSVKAMGALVKAFGLLVQGKYGDEVAKLHDQFVKMFPQEWWVKMTRVAGLFTDFKTAIKSVVTISAQLAHGITDVKKYSEAYQNLEEIFGTKFARKVLDVASAFADFFRGNETSASGISKLVDKIGAGNIAFTAFKFAISALFGPIGLLINAFLTLAKFLGEGSVLNGIKKIAEGFMNLTTSVGEASTNVGQGVGNMLLGITTAIAEFLPYLFEGAAQIVVGLVQGLLQSMPLWIEAIKGLLNIITTVIIELVPAIAESGVKIIKALTEGIMTVVPVLIQSFTQIVVMILAELSKAVPKLIEKGTEFVTTLSNSISNNLPKLIAAGTNVIVAFLKGLKDNLPRIVNAAVDLIVTWVNTIASRMGDIVNAAVNLIINFANAMIKRMPEIIDVAVTIVVTLVDGLARNADRLVGSAINLLAALIDGIANNLYRLRTSARNLVRKIVEFVVGFANDMWEAAVALLEGLADGINNNRERVRRALWEVVSALGRLAFGDVLWNNGIALIRGLWDGMLAQWQNVKEWVGGIADWIADHKGPVPYDKTVLIENGMALMFGLDRGLKKGFENVKETVGAMAGQLQNELAGTLETDMNMGATLNSNLTRDMASSNGVAGIINNTQQTPITINIEGDVDSSARVQQLAEAVSVAQLKQYRNDNQWK